MKSLVRYLPALFTSLVWGTTFVASKVVLSAGVTPLQLMFARFCLGSRRLFFYALLAIALILRKKLH